MKNGFLHNKRVTSVLYILLFFCAISPCLADNLQSLDPKSTKILVINSYHIQDEWASSVINGIKDVLGNELYNEVSFEYMDTRRKAFNDVFFGFKEYLATKYLNASPDIIMVCDTKALDFLLMYRQELFPEIPVIFCGINYLDPEILNGQSNITGVNEAVDIKGTIDLARQVHPEVKEMYCVYVPTATGFGSLEDVQSLEASFRGKLDFKYISTKSMDEIPDKVKDIPDGSFVLASCFFMNADSSWVDLDYQIKLLSENSPVPVYSLWDFCLGSGVIGGKVISGREQGRQAAEMAMEVLNGKPIDQIPLVMNSPNARMFDYEQLVRFGISPDKIPVDSVIINQPTSFYARYKGYLWLTGMSFGVMVILLFILSGAIIHKNRAVRELASSEKRFRAFFERSPDGIIITDPETKMIIDVNTAACDLISKTSQQLIGLSIMTLFPDDMQRLPENIFTGQPCRFEWTCIEDHQGRIPVEIRTQKVQLKAKDYIVAIFRNNTQRKLAEYENKLLLTSLQEKSEEMQKLLYIISHDLRSPLVNIQGFCSELTRDFKEFYDILEKMPEEQKEEPLAKVVIKSNVSDSLEYVIKSAEKMNRLLKGLARLSQVGRMEMEFQQLDMNNLVDQVIATVKYEADERDVTIETQELHPCRGDSLGINQVFGNLIGNAIKYSNPHKSGRVEVTSSVESGMVTYCVSDNGIGIPEIHADRIFDVFHRVDPLDGTSGEGIGLAAVKQIVSLHEGEVWFESTTKAGSSFYVSIPQV